jgi:hypothetical protein
MKRHVQIVIAVVLIFVGLIIAYTLESPDRSAAGEPPKAAAKSH